MHEGRETVVTIHDGISDIKIVEDGREASYSLEHLWDLVVTIPNFHFEDGRNIGIFVSMFSHVEQWRVELF